MMSLSLARHGDRRLTEGNADPAVGQVLVLDAVLPRETNLS